MTPPFAKSILAALSVCVTTLFAVSTARAQTAGSNHSWNVAAGTGGDLSVTTDWTPNVTAATDFTDGTKIFDVSNSGTAAITSNFNLQQLWIGQSGGATSIGTANQTGGALNLVEGLVVGRQGGTGTYNQTGGTLNTRALRLGGGTSTATGTMTVSGSGTVLNTDAAVVNSGNATGSGSLVVGVGVNGTGTFTLQNSATWNNATGTPVVVGGDNVAVGAANNTATGGKGTLNVLGGATLNFNGASLSIGRNPGGNGTLVVNGGTITGTGAVNLASVNGGTAGGTGALTLGSGAITAASINANEGTATFNFNGGTITTGAMARLNGSNVANPGNATATFNGATVNASASNTDFHAGYSKTGLTIGGGGYLLNTGNYAVAINQPLNGTGPFVKTGGGSLTFGGANTYTGTTTINAGSLMINGNAGSATGAVSVAGGGALGGTGTVGGGTTVASGAMVTGATPGTVGTLAFTSGLTINGRYQVDVTNGASDSLAVAGALTIGSGSSLTVNVTSAGLTAAKYVLASYGSLTNGTNVHFTTESLPAGYTLNYGATELDLVGTPGPSVPRPNVIVMLVDDLGWSDLGCYGGEIQTPNLDALAATGTRFRQFYNGARCAPSRIAVLTGLYPQQGAVDPGAELPNLRNDNNVTIAELLHSNGYHTYLAGKWNLGVGPTLPEARGFEHCWRFLDGNSHSEDQWNISRYTQASTTSSTSDPEIAPVNYTGTNPFYQTDAVGDYSVKFIDHDIAKADGDPFFIYMAFGAPHFPLGAPGAVADTYMQTYSQGWDVVRQNRYNNMLSKGVIDSRYPYPPLGGTPPENDSGEPIENLPTWASIDSGRQADLTRRMALYAAMVQEVDTNVAKVVNHLKDIGQLDNTLILFLSDNGANYEYGKFGTWTGSATGPALTGSALANMGQNDTNDGIKYGGGWAHMSNTPLRLFKHFAHEGGIRTPLIAHWPAGFTGTGGWTEEVGHIIDILPTVAAATGSAYPSTYNNHAVLPVQGISILPALQGNPLPARNLEVEHETNRMIRQGKWKLVTKDYTLSDYSSYANQLELYDMSVDPGESNNLTDSYPALVLQLIDQWNAWANFVGVPVVRDLPDPPANLTPGSTSADLFVDTFNRPYSIDIDSSTTGMSGSLLPSLAGGPIWFEGYEGSGYPDSIMNAESVLRMAVGVGMSENGLNHNFVDSSITAAGGFSVSLRTLAFYSDGTDPANRYMGFGVGLNAAQAAAGNDIGTNVASPRPIRGNTGNPGCADCFVELDENNNVKVWVHGVLQSTVRVGTPTGTLTASFSLNNAASGSSSTPPVSARKGKKRSLLDASASGANGFNAGDAVTLSVYFNDQRLNLNSSSPNGTLSFTWDEANANYLALSARATNYAIMDDFAVRLLPLADSMAVDYAQGKGLDGADAAPTADPDNDGLDNYGEWAFGTDPTKSDRFLANTTLTSTNIAAQGFIFAHRRLVDYANLGVAYRYAVSPDLVVWHYVTPTAVSTASLPNSPGYEAVQLRIPDSETVNQSRLFVRVEVPH